MSADRLERELSEDEPVLFEGRPRGLARPRGTDLLGYGLLLATGALLLLVGWWTVQRYPSRSWQLGWGTIEFTGAGGGSRMSTGMPSPFAWLVLAAILELHRQAAVRSLRVLVTARRLLTSEGVFRTKLASIPRAGREGVHEVAGGLELRDATNGLALALPGFDAADAEGLRVALATFDPTPPPPLRQRWRPSRRQLVALGGSLAVLSSVWGWWYGTRHPVTLEVRWTTGAPPVADQLYVRVDAPYWVPRRVRLLKAEPVDDTGTPVSAGGGGGGAGTGLFRTEAFSSDRLPRGLARVRVLVAARWWDPDRAYPVPRLPGEPVPGEFTVELSRGEELELTLVEGEDGALAPAEDDAGAE